MASPCSPTVSNDARIVMPDRITLSSGWMSTEDAAGRIAFVGGRPATEKTRTFVAAAFDTSSGRAAAGGPPVATQTLTDSPASMGNRSAMGINIDFRLGDAASTGIVIDRCWLDAEAERVATGLPSNPDQTEIQLEFASYDLLLRVSSRIDLADAADLPHEPSHSASVSQSGPSGHGADGGGESDTSETEIGESDDLHLDRSVTAHSDHVQTILPTIDLNDLLHQSTPDYAGELQTVAIALTAIDVMLHHASRSSKTQASTDHDTCGSFGAYRYSNLPGGSFHMTVNASTVGDTPEFTISDCWLGGPATEIDALDPNAPIVSDPVAFVLPAASGLDDLLRSAAESGDSEPLMIGFAQHISLGTLAACNSETICEPVHAATDCFEINAFVRIDRSHDELEERGVDRQIAEFTPLVFEIVPGCFLTEEQSATMNPVALALAFATDLEDAQVAAPGSRSISAREYQQLYWNRTGSKGESTQYDFLLRPDRPDRLQSAWVLKSRIPQLRKRKRRRSARRH
jgi:hypothetical protein